MPYNINMMSLKKNVFTFLIKMKEKIRNLKEKNCKTQM